MHPKRVFRTVAAATCLAALSTTAICQVNPSYQELARQPESYLGKVIYFRGQVVQSVQDGRDYVLRVNVSPGAYETWKDTVLR